MTRSTWKGPFSCVPCEASTSKVNFAATPQENQRAKEKKKQLWSRASMILPDHIGKEFFVYNGKSWVSLKILEEMIGHKFGEFSSTRKKQISEIRGKKSVLKLNTQKQSTRRK